MINGFLIVPNVIREIEEGTFKYLQFLLKRISRLLPVLICACAFSNNILAGITTKNYWDVVNEYKPLMHTWYLGILMEYYVLLPILLIVYRKVCQTINKEKM